MTAPSISVIVPTYGRPAFLADALESVAAQTVRDFECIVVDDASPEPVVLRLPDSRFRLVRRQSNGGPAAARNTALALVAARVIAFLDDDDLFTPQRLEIALQGIERAPIAICAGGFRALEGNVYDTILDELTPNLGTTAVRAEMCVRFDERYRACEDVDWWLRMTHSNQVTSDARAGWIWRRHDGLRSTHGDQARIDGSLQLMADHAEYFRTHRRATAFRWRRVSRLALQTKQPTLRRRAALASARHDLRPANVSRALKLYLGR